MNIVYIWIDQYECFANNEFNFLSKYHFHYDKDNQSLIFEDHSDDYVDCFFGNNIDVTAVVGNNGAGKTTLQKFLFSLLKGDSILTKCIIVFEKCDINAQLTVYHTNMIKESFSNKQLELSVIENKNGYRLPKEIVSRIIFFTRSFDYSQFRNQFAGADNLSIASRLYNQISHYRLEEDEDKCNIVSLLHNEDTVLQIDFLSIKKKEIEAFDIQYPKFATASIVNDDWVFADWYDATLYSSENDEIEKDLVDEAKELLNSFLPEYKGGGFKFFKDRFTI